MMLGSGEGRRTLCDSARLLVIELATKIECRRFSWPV